ncbi:MAG: alpha-amylase family glycosyl hydrolase [Bacillota bacterium]
MALTIQKGRMHVCAAIVRFLILLVPIFAANWTLRAHDALEVVRAAEYIDLDAETVKFLFRTAPGSRVTLMLGESPAELRPVRTAEGYRNEGLKVDGLVPGRTYYYRIEAEYGGERAKTEVLSFVKRDYRPWKNAAWARTAVFYEVFVRSFADGDGDGIGDLRGLRARLPYLKDLGVDALWLMPIMPSPSYHGYDVEDYRAVEPDYGTMADFRAFLAEAHRLGLRVILDLPVNHTSSNHPWFVASRRGDPEYRHYYVWADRYEDRASRGPWGQKIWYRSGDNWFMAIFWEGMPDLNLRHPAVREEIKQVARFWLDPDGDGDPSDGVDGFRLDAAMHIDHEDPEVTHAWWREFNDCVKSINPEAFLVAENMTTNASVVAPYFAILDSSFNFGLAEWILRTAGGGGTDLLRDLLGVHDLYRKQNQDFIDAIFLSNHDTTRTATRLAGIPERIKLACSLLLTLPGTPFLYYGEEIGQEGAKPDENIREPMDWYAAGRGPGMTVMARWTGMPVRFVQPNDGVSVEEQASDPESILNHYKRMIAIRKSHPILFTGRYRPLDLPGLLAYECLGADGRPTLTVMHNPGRREVRVEVRPGLRDLVSGRKTGRSLIVKPCETVILEAAE